MKLIDIQRDVLIKYIKNQTNVDLIPLIHERQMKPTKYLEVNVRGCLSHSDYHIYRKLESLSLRDNKMLFTIEDNGGFGSVLYYRSFLKEKAKKWQLQNKKVK
jgi:hypothetical protein